MRSTWPSSATTWFAATQAAAWYAARSSSATCTRRAPRRVPIGRGERIARDREGHAAEQPLRRRPAALGSGTRGCSDGACAGAAPRTSRPSDPDRCRTHAALRRGRPPPRRGRARRRGPRARARRRRAPRRRGRRHGRAARRRRRRRSGALGRASVPALPAPMMRIVAIFPLCVPALSGAVRSVERGECTDAGDLALGEASSTAGATRFGREVGQWLQDEAALPHPRMGHDEVGVVDGEVPDQEHVAVERPGPEAHRADPARRGLRAPGSARGARGASRSSRARRRRSGTGPARARRPGRSRRAARRGRGRRRGHGRDAAAQVRGAVAEVASRATGRRSTQRATRRRTATVARSQRDGRAELRRPSTVDRERPRSSAPSTARPTSSQAASRSCGRAAVDRRDRGVAQLGVVDGVGDVVARRGRVERRPRRRGRRSSGWARVRSSSSTPQIATTRSPRSSIRSVTLTGVGRRAVPSRRRALGRRVPWSARRGARPR